MLTDVHGGHRVAALYLTRGSGRMDKLGIGLIGVGGMGSEHLRCLLRLDGANVVAVSDLDPAKLERASGLTGGKAATYSDYHQLLQRDDVSAVFISVPEFWHKEVALACFAAGKDVFLEKPMATKLRDVDEVIIASQQADRLMQIGLVYRYSSFYRSMKSLLTGVDGIPRILMMWCKEHRLSFPPTPWYHSQERTGGAINEKDCHHFDLFNWMIERRARRVCAFGARSVLVPGGDYLCEWPGMEPVVIDYGDNVDHAEIIIDYGDGITAHLSLNLALQPADLSLGFPLEIGAIGFNGRVMMSDVVSGEISFQGGRGRTAEKVARNFNDPNDAAALSHAGGMQEHVEFLECLRTRRHPYADGIVGRESMLPAFAAEKSIKEGRIIEIDEILDEGLLPKQPYRELPMPE
jgi:myo-inositol 2-dehydrogenase / D-chiro-inositol 1-dehydrogenase